MSKLIIGNWKMNGSIGLVDEFVSGLNSKVILGLPSIFISYVHHKDPKLNLAAQDCSVFSDFGAHTGEISAKMLAEAGCKYVIIGHSERRLASNLDTISNVLLKLGNVISNEMTAILCVGEKYTTLVDKPTTNLIKNHIDKIVIAYEPISAIGTGNVPTLDEIDSVMQNIKHKYFNVRTLYGGSVNTKNCNNILSISSVDGVLVGGASLQLSEISTIASYNDLN